MEWILLLTVAGVLLLAYTGARLHERRALRQPTRACLSCGSTHTRITGATMRCEDCGHEGQADGGGALDASDRRALRLSQPEL